MQNKTTKNNYGKEPKKITILFFCWDQPLTKLKIIST